MNLSEIDINDLDIEDLKKIGAAPLPVKIAIIIVLCIALAIASYFLDTTKQIAELNNYCRRTAATKCFLRQTGKSR